MISSQLNETTNNLLTTEGSSAYQSSSAQLGYLPFDAPDVAKVEKALDRISSKKELQSAKVVTDIINKLQTSDSQKQGTEPFDFEGNKGTYTFNDYVYDEYDNIIDANWIIDSTNTENITIIIPAEYSDTGEEFKTVLNDYAEELISWTDDYDGSYSEYYPTLVDYDMFVDNDLVLGLDFTAEWKYNSYVDDVVPTDLSLTLDLDPYSISITYEQADTVETYSFSMNEGQTTLLSIDVELTYTDDTLAELYETEGTYQNGSIEIAFYQNSTYMDYLDSANYTAQGEVDMINAGENIFVNISNNGSVIGHLQAKLVWDPEAGDYDNETGTYTGDSVAESYILFNDGSSLTMEELGLDEDMVK